MVDENGYRPNVAMVVMNHQKQVLYCKRYGLNSWQFPQGGIKSNETPLQAFFREVKEEVGLKPRHLRILGKTQDWIYYDLPQRLVRREQLPLCIGQKQVWILALLLTSDDDIQLSNPPQKQEFDSWSWIDYWDPIKTIVNFKRDAYHKALIELEPYKDAFDPS